MEDLSNSKRRRGLGVVTPNACTECRKKRAKCDGQTPCGRCASQKNVDCIYEVPVRQSKEHMRSEIEQLREYQRQSERVLAAVVSMDRSDQVLEQLRNGKTLKTLSDMLENLPIHQPELQGNVTTYDRFSDHLAIGSALKPARDIISTPFSALNSGDIHGSGAPKAEAEGWSNWQSGSATLNAGGGPGSHDDLMSWTPESESVAHQGFGNSVVGTWHVQSGGHSSPDSTVQYARDQGQETILGQSFPIELHGETGHMHTESWTTVTSDSNFVEHLMALYFCWEYPTFASLSKEHFLEDFRLGKTENCSQLLVNSILALGCRFSTQAQARTNPNDSSTAGDHFFAEAIRLLKLEKDHHILTTIQAMGLMSIREASCGRSSHSLFLSGQSIKLAIEMGLHCDAESDVGETSDIKEAVRAATFWGAFSLDQAWSLTVGRLPHFSWHTKLSMKPAVVNHIEASAWIPYTDDGAPLERYCSQPSNIRSVYKTFCELSEIVHQSLYIIYAPSSNFTSHSLIEIYTQFLRWYDAIPAALRLGHNFTPAVLFSHMYYHYAILLLFRPFIKLKIVGSSVSPRDVCNQAADAISALVNSYSKLYTLRRTPSFVPYFVLTSSITHLMALAKPDLGPKHLQQGLADLKDMSGCHLFAVRAGHILRFLAKHWGIVISFDEDAVETEALKVLCRPSSASLNLFCPNIEAADMPNGIHLVSKEDNPLFWPFPLQGRPLLGCGDQLEKTGFALLT